MWVALTPPCCPLRRAPYTIRHECNGAPLSSPPSAPSPPPISRRMQAAPGCPAGFARHLWKITHARTISRHCLADSSGELPPAPIRSRAESTKADAASASGIASARFPAKSSPRKCQPRLRPLPSLEIRHCVDEVARHPELSFLPRLDAPSAPWLRSRQPERHRLLLPHHR